MTSTGNSVGTKPQSGGVHQIEALERLKAYESGRSPYKAWRGEAPEGEPTLRRDLRSLLSSYEAQGERLREVEGALGWIAATNFDGPPMPPLTSRENDLGFSICEIQRVARSALTQPPAMEKTDA